MVIQQLSIGNARWTCFMHLLCHVSFFFALQTNITFYLNANSQVIDNIFGPIFPYTRIQMVFDMFGIHTLSR